MGDEAGVVGTVSRGCAQFNGGAGERAADDIMEEVAAAQRERSRRRVCGSCGEQGFHALLWLAHPTAQPVVAPCLRPVPLPPTTRSTYTPTLTPTYTQTHNA